MRAARNHIVHNMEAQGDIVIGAARVAIVRCAPHLPQSQPAWVAAPPETAEGLGKEHNHESHR